MGMYFDVTTKKYEFSAKNVTEILTYLHLYNSGRCEDKWYHDNDYYVSKQDIENILTSLWEKKIEERTFYDGRLSGVLEMLRDTINWELEMLIILGLN